MLRLVDTDLWGLFCVLHHAVASGYLQGSDIEWAVDMMERIDAERDVLAERDEECVF